MLERTLVDNVCTVLAPIEGREIPREGFVISMWEFVSDFGVTEDTEAWGGAIEMLLLKYQMNGFMRAPQAGIQVRLCTEDDSEQHLHFAVVFVTPARESACVLSQWFGKQNYFDLGTKELIDSGGEDIDPSQHNGRTC